MSSRELIASLIAIQQLILAQKGDSEFYRFLLAAHEQGFGLARRAFAKERGL